MKVLRPRHAATILAGALACSVASAEPAYAQSKRPAHAASAEERGAELFKQSIDAYRRGDFATTVRLLNEAYALDPQPVLLYNLARAYEGLGENDKAIETYDRYLEVDPKAPDRGAIEQRVNTLKRQRDERIALEKAREEARLRAESNAQSAPAATPADAPVGPPRPRSPLPYVVVGVGAAGLVTGAVVGLMATSKHDQATTEPVHATALDMQAQASSLATVSTVAFVAGAALVLAGAAWWVVDGQRDSGRGKTSAPVRVGIAPGFFVFEKVMP